MPQLADLAVVLRINREPSGNQASDLAAAEASFDAEEMSHLVAKRSKEVDAERLEVARLSRWPPSSTQHLMVLGILACAVCGRYAVCDAFRVQQLNSCHGFHGHYSLPTTAVES